jgi:hypothetical protein
MKTHHIKVAVISLAISALLTSCASTYEAIGKVNMLSAGHLTPNLNYKKLTANAGGRKKDVKHSKATTMQQAIKQVVDKVPDGRFMTNVTVYIVNGGYYAVSGNVWGVGNDSIPHQYTSQSSPATSDSEDMNYFTTTQPVLK